MTTMMVTTARTRTTTTTKMNTTTRTTTTMTTTMRMTKFIFLNASKCSTYFMYSHIGFLARGGCGFKPSFFYHDDIAWYGRRVGLITP
jgi:hypothetical protein